MLHFWVCETYIGPARAGGGGSCRISKTCILTIFKMYVTFLGSPPSKAVGMFFKNLVFPDRLFWGGVRFSFSAF